MKKKLMEKLERELKKGFKAMFLVFAISLITFIFSSLNKEIINNNDLLHLIINGIAPLLLALSMIVITKKVVKVQNIIKRIM